MYNGSRQSRIHTWRDLRDLCNHFQCSLCRYATLRDLAPHDASCATYVTWIRVFGRVTYTNPRCAELKFFNFSCDLSRCGDGQSAFCRCHSVLRAQRHHLDEPVQYDMKAAHYWDRDATDEAWEKVEQDHPEIALEPLIIQTELQEEAVEFRQLRSSPGGSVNPKTVAVSALYLQASSESGAVYYHTKRWSRMWPRKACYVFQETTPVRCERSLMQG